MAELYYTYPRYAEWLRKELAAHDDAAFAVRVLGHTVSAIRSLQCDEEFVRAHGEPGSTGSADWDRVIRAAAELTYSDRFPEATPEWCTEQEEPLAEWFYPTSNPARFSFNLSRTPAPFLQRRICLGEGNLRTARDWDRPWI